MGEFTHFLAGGILGIALLLILFVTGSRFGVIKGIGLGLALWIVHVAIIPNLVSPRPYIYRIFNEALVDMGAHFAWGAITTLLLLYTFYDRRDRVIKGTVKRTNFSFYKEQVNNGKISIRSKK